MRAPRPSTLGRAIAPVLVGALVAASPLHAQGTPVSATGLAAPGTATTIASAVARLEGIPDARVRRALAEALTDADRRGLPLEPLVAKALEGVEKDAPPARIEAAVRGMAGRLASAREALSPAVTDREVTAGADALATGVPVDVLRRLRALSPRRSTAVALGVLAQLVSRGVPVTQAATTVQRLVQGRAADHQLLAFEREVQRDLSTGIAAVTALELRTRPLIATLPVPAGAATAGDGLVTPASAPTPPKGPGRSSP
jgi:hypothetical protein